MPTVSLRRPALAAAFASALFACGRTPITLPDEPPTVDPYIYALGFCSLKCYRLDQCALAMQSTDACEDACIAEALATLPDDPCWAEQIELRRCSVREAECDGVADEELPAGSSACDHRQQQLDACDS